MYRELWKCTCDSDLNTEGLVADNILYYNGVDSTVRALS